MIPRGRTRRAGPLVGPSPCGRVLVSSPIRNQPRPSLPRQVETARRVSPDCFSTNALCYKRPPADAGSSSNSERSLLIAKVVRIAANLNRNVLDQPNRRRIVQHLTVQPGDHFRSIVRSLDLSVGTTRHHLTVLAKEGLVRSERIGSKCRYFALAQGRRAPLNETYRMFWRFRELRMRVWSALQRIPDPRPSTVAASLGVSRQLAAYHLKRLAQQGLVVSDRGRYRPVNPRTGEVDLYRRPVVRSRVLEDSFRLGSATRALTTPLRTGSVPHLAPRSTSRDEVAPEVGRTPAAATAPTGPRLPEPGAVSFHEGYWSSRLDAAITSAGR
jgi:predicted transcriptional regulator